MTSRKNTGIKKEQLKKGAKTMKTNEMTNEEMMLSKEDLQQVNGGHSVRCIGCGETISSWSAILFSAKVKTHNRYCVFYQEAIRRNYNDYGQSNFYAYLYK